MRPTVRPWASGTRLGVAANAVIGPRGICTSGATGGWSADVAGIAIEPRTCGAVRNTLGNYLCRGGLTGELLSDGGGVFANRRHRPERARSVARDRRRCGD